MQLQEESKRSERKVKIESADSGDEGGGDEGDVSDEDDSGDGNVEEDSSSKGSQRSGQVVRESKSLKQEMKNSKQKVLSFSFRSNSFECCLSHTQSTFPGKSNAEEKNQVTRECRGCCSRG